MHGGGKRKARRGKVEAPASGLGPGGGGAPEGKGGFVDAVGGVSVKLRQKPRGGVRIGEDVVDVGRAHEFDRFHAGTSAKGEIKRKGAVRRSDLGLRAAAGFGGLPVAAAERNARKEPVSRNVAVNPGFAGNFHFNERAGEVFVGLVVRGRADARDAGFARTHGARGGG